MPGSIGPRRLSYEALKQWLWDEGYDRFITFIEWQEEHYPNLMADIHLYPEGSFLAFKITMRDKSTYTVHSEANIPTTMKSVTI